MRVLEAYNWPGNVRQLIHLMQRVVILNDGELLSSDMLPQEIFCETQPGAPLAVEFVPSPDTSQVATVSRTVPLQTNAVCGFTFATKDDIVTLEEIERMAISRAIRLCDGSAYEAARLLGISSATIYRKIKLYDLSSD